MLHKPRKEPCPGGLVFFVRLGDRWPRLRGQIGMPHHQRHQVLAGPPVARICRAVVGKSVRTFLEPQILSGDRRSPKHVANGGTGGAGVAPSASTFTRSTWPPTHLDWT